VHGGRWPTRRVWSETITLAPLSQWQYSGRFRACPDASLGPAEHVPSFQARFQGHAEHAGHRMHLPSTDSRRWWACDGPARVDAGAHDGSNRRRSGPTRRRGCEHEGRNAFGFRNPINQRRRIRWACARQHRQVSATIPDVPVKCNESGKAHLLHPPIGRCAGPRDARDRLFRRRIACREGRADKHQNLLP